MAALKRRPDPDTYIAVLDAHCISRVEFVILRIVALGPFPADGFDTRVADLWRDLFPFPSPSRLLLRREIARCVENGLLRVVDDLTLLELRSSLATKGIASTLYGGPEVGALDFTAHGAATYCSIQRSLDPNWNPDDFEVYLSRTEKWYFATEERAHKELAAAAAERTSEVVQLVNIGPWRARWWERHEAGFMAEVMFRDSEDAYAGASQGRETDPTKPPKFEEPPAIRRLNIWPWLGKSDYDDLQSRYGMRRGEWLVLSALGEDPQRAPGAAGSARERSFCESLGEASSQECEAAVARCIEKGWAIVIDDKSLQEVNAFLAREPSIGPLEPVPYVGFLDLTPSGAKVYREVERQFGKGLHPSDNVFVTVETSSISERYFLSEQRALIAIAELRRDDRTVSVDGPTLLAPFCCDWWKVDPAAYCVRVHHRGQVQGQSEDRPSHGRSGADGDLPNA